MDMQNYLITLKRKGYSISGRIARRKTPFGEWVQKIQTDGKRFWLETVTYPEGMAR